MKEKFPIMLLVLAGGLLIIHPCRVSAAEGSFVNKRKIEGLKIGQFTYSQTVTRDELTMIFAADGRLYQATRATADDEFANPALLNTLNVSGFEQTFPSTTDDGLIVIFQRDPAGPTANSDLSIDLYQASRSSVGEPFGSVIRLSGEVNTHADQAPHISGRGLTLYFSSFRPGGHGGADIWVATRSSVNDPFGAPVNFNDFYPGSAVNSTADEYGPSLSSDGLTLFFSDWFGTLRPGGQGGGDIWVTTRANAEAPFPTPVNLNDFSLSSAVNTARNQNSVSISPRWPVAGAKLYFATDEGTGSALNPEIWETTWEPAPGPETPELGIHGGFVTLTWPITEGIFAIEAAPTIDGPWTVLNRPMQEIGSGLEVIVPTSEASRFFRLTPATGLPDNLFERRIAGSYLVDFPDGSRLLLNVGLGGGTHRESGDDFIGLTGLPDLPFAYYGGGFGNWVRTGPHGIQIVELAFQFDSKGVVTAIPKVRIAAEFKPDFQSATATATVEVFLPDQDPLTGTPLPGPAFEGIVLRKIR